MNLFKKLKEIVSNIREYRTVPSFNFDPPSPSTEKATEEATKFVEKTVQLPKGKKET